MIIFYFLVPPDYAILGLQMGRKEKFVCQLDIFHGIALKRNEKCFHLHEDLKQNIYVCLYLQKVMCTMCAGAPGGQRS